MVEINGSPIVVGIDGSQESLAALRWAFASGIENQQPVDVVHCWKPQTISDVLLASSRELQNASVIMLQNEIRIALSELTVKPQVSHFSVADNPASALIERSAGASTLVLGAHNRTVLKDLVLGGVARACLKNSRCPVVIVDRDGRVLPTSTATALGRPL